MNMETLEFRDPNSSFTAEEEGEHFKDFDDKVFKVLNGRAAYPRFDWSTPFVSIVFEHR